MKKLMILSAFLPLLATGQTWEDFSDGDFTANPAWSGDVNHFKISSSTAVPAAQRPALQLDAPAAGVSYLSTGAALSGNLEWQAWIKMSFNTSSGNFARFYMLADTSNLSAPLKGYFLQVGGAGDSVSFHRQDSVDIKRLFTLPEAFTGNSTNSLRFRVTRDTEGRWEFQADLSGGNSLAPSGSVTDAEYEQGQSFGIFCQYTSSNATKFYFDDFYFGPQIIDSIAPVLLKVKVNTPEEILLVFDEAVDKALSESASNYEVAPEVGFPYAAVRLLDPAQVMLFFDTPLENGVPYNLVINNMKDEAGNETGMMTRPVMHYHPRPHDVIITEIMADPTPPFALPEYEYLELLNRSPFDIDLENWALYVSSSVYTLPSFLLKPGEYMLVSGTEGAAIFQNFGQAAGFSSFSLPNNGTSVRLADKHGSTICYLQYGLSWYRDSDKSAGGWSLEMIDTESPCLGEVNWSASASPVGGTPGRENAWQPFTSRELSIAGICLAGPNTLDVTFNQALDSLSAAEPWRYICRPGSLLPDSVIVHSPGFAKVTVTYSQNFQDGLVYELSMEQGMVICTGEELPLAAPAPFALSGDLSPFDVILNEILFNPLGDGVDYVEIFNRSGKVIDLSGLALATVKETPPNPPDTQSYAVILPCRLLFPEEYLVLTSDPEKVKSQFNCPGPGVFLQMASFPSYNNDKGFALLLSGEGTVIDGFHYHEEMHHKLLLSVDGVALERISAERLGDVADNWHSAAEAVGFGTPGYRNSQSLESRGPASEVISIHPDVFSPDGDGVNDQLGIGYTFDSPGKLVTAMIFTADGRRARLLVNNEMTGTSGLFSWDGTFDDRMPAPDGIYVVYLEALGMDGRAGRFKKACVLSRAR